MRRPRTIFGVLLIGGALLAACQPAGNGGTSVVARIPAVSVQYTVDFATFDNGHMVEPPFLDTYKAMEGERWLGRPIARPLLDSNLGWQLQVFEFGVLAQDPTDNHIFLIKMSDVLGRRQPGTEAAKDPSCQYSQITGHNLCYEFRDYALAAGIEHLGQPVSEISLDSNGVMFQDFEYMRLQWYGGNMDRERIGETFFALRGYDLSLRAPVTGNAGPATGSSQLYASLARSSLRPGEMQNLRVALTDPTGAGIAGIPLRVTLEENGKAILEIALPQTDSAGIATLSFIVPQAEAGTRIRVIVRGSVGSESLEAIAEFEVWW